MSSASSLDPKILLQIGNPKVIHEYQEAGMFDQYEPSPEEINEWKFHQKRNKEVDVIHSINQIYRIKVGSKEYLMYNEIMRSTDMMGNTLSHPALRGRIEAPEFTKKYDEEMGKAVATSLLGKKTVYEIPFSRQAVLDILALDKSDSTPSLVVASGRVKYSDMFTLNEFMTRSVDDLMVKGATGQFPNNNSNNPSTGANEQPQPKVKEVKRGLVKTSETTEEHTSTDEVVTGVESSSNSKS